MNQEQQPTLTALDACQHLLDIARVMDSQCLKRPVYAFVEVAAECRAIGYLWLNDMHIQLVNEPMEFKQKLTGENRDEINSIRNTIAKDLSVRIDKLWAEVNDLMDTAGLPSVALAELDMNDIRTAFQAYISCKESSMNTLGLDAVEQIERVAQAMLKRA
ncbi:MAG: hypothetical protein MRY32_09865 [Rickettsiales bacterium]|nr:hypothetical protein [Rickettsiales bacterium]